MSASFVHHRDCPSCGRQGGAPEISSRPAAETLGLEELKEAWEGLHGNQAFFTYHRCQQCKLLYNPVYFTNEVLSRLYSDIAPNMEMVADELARRTQQSYFDDIAAEADLSGGYLEIGPDVGYLVAEAARRGQFEHMWLYEPNCVVHDRLRAAAGANQVSLSAGMADLSEVPSGTIGLAVMVHVLDHLVDPLETLREISSKLRPGGMLATVTHNEASLLARALGRRWPPFCLQHPQLFNPKTMRTLMHRAGLSNVDVRRSSNYFSSDFLVRQAAQATGLGMGRLPLPAFPVRLRLGNILTIARAPL